MLEFFKKGSNNISQPTSSFSMIVDDCFTITGRGIAVTGTVTEGSVENKDTVYVNGEPYQVLGIEADRKMISVATAGMTVGLLINASIRFAKGTVITDRVIG